MPFIIPIFLCITPIRKFNFNLTPHFPIKNLFRRKHSIKHYSSFSLPYFTRNFNFIIPTYLRFPIKKTSFRSFQLLQFTNNFIPLPGESHQTLAPQLKWYDFNFTLVPFPRKSNPLHSGKPLTFHAPPTRFPFHHFSFEEPTRISAPDYHPLPLE